MGIGLNLLPEITSNNDKANNRGQVDVVVFKTSVIIDRNLTD